MQFGLIAAVYYLGELLHLVLPLPVPGTIYGLVLLFLLLQTGLLRLSHVEQAADFLLSFLPLLFLPGAVGLMNEGELLGNYGIAIVTISLATTVSTLFVTGHAAQLTGRFLMKRKKSTGGGDSNGGNME